MNKKIKKAFSLVSVSTTLISGFSVGKICYGMRSFQRHQTERIALTEAEVKEIKCGWIARRLGLTVNDTQLKLDIAAGILLLCITMRGQFDDDVIIDTMTDRFIQVFPENLRNNPFLVRLARVRATNMFNHVIAIGRLPQQNLQETLIKINQKCSRLLVNNLLDDLRLRRIRTSALIAQVRERPMDYINDALILNALLNQAIIDSGENAVRIIENILERRTDLTEYERLFIESELAEARLMVENPPVAQQPAQN